MSCAEGPDTEARTAVVREAEPGTVQLRHGGRAVGRANMFLAGHHGVHLEAAWYTQQITLAHYTPHTENQPGGYMTRNATNKH